MTATALVRWTGDTHEVVVTLPIKTVSETNQREHHMSRYRRRKKQRHAAGLMCSAPLCDFREGLAKGYVPGLVVTLTRIAPRSLDSDNLVSSGKGPRDGIADALGIDDGDERVEWRYEQARGKPREYAVRVVVGRKEST